MRRKSRLGDDQRDLFWPVSHVSPDWATAWKVYQREFDDRAGRFEPAARDAVTAAYTCTVLSAKPDPLGRQILMDCRVDKSGRYDTDTILTLTGNPAPSVYAKVYADGQRQHGAPGARVKRTGLGSVAYMCSALAAYVWAGHDEVYSPSPGNPAHDRTSDADYVWRGLNKHGVAYQTSDSTTQTGTQDDYCAYVNGNEITVFGTDGTEYEATITSEDVCGPIEYEYEADYTTDWLGKDAILQTGLVVFTLGGMMMPDLDSSWVLEKGKLKSNGKTYDQPNLDVFDDFSLSKDTAEMLARSYHGPSLPLILQVAKTLNGAAGEDVMMGYLLRKDIAHAAAGHARYLELLGQQRLPGIDGVSLAGVNEIRAAHLAAANGKLLVDPSSSNPLDLPSLSKSAQRKINQLPED